jgi:hypothetical protein
VNDTATPKTAITDREARLFAQVPANRDRFLAAIAERIPPERIQAVYLFPPIKQGVVETGVAVVAADREEHEKHERHERHGLGLELGVVDEEEFDEGAGDDGFGDDEILVDDAFAETVVADDDAVVTDDDFVAVDGDIVAPPPPVRPVVYTASYRHTLKGADRGKWTVEIMEQADAPLATIEMVVAGVTQRRDEATEPERLDAEAVREAIAAGTWTTPTR